MSAPRTPDRTDGGHRSPPPAFVGLGLLVLLVGFLLWPRQLVSQFIAGGKLIGVATTSTSTTSTTTTTVGGPLVTLPADRAFTWQPGVTYNGGIPVRTTDCPASSGGPLAAGSSQATLQAAINGCSAGQVLRLACGTFNVSGIDNPLVVSTSNITIRGCGVPDGSGTLITKSDGAVLGVDAQQNPSGVIRIGTSSGTSDSAQGSFSSWDNATSNALASDGLFGTTSVTLSNAAGFAAGQYVLLDDDEWTSATYVAAPHRNLTPQVSLLQTDRYVWKNTNPVDCTQDDTQGACPNGHTTCSDAGAAPTCVTFGYNFFRNKRPANEIKKIFSVSGNVVTFTSPLALTYYTARSAQLTRPLTPFAEGIGLEDLHITRGTSGSVGFNACAGCWLKRVQLDTYRGEAAQLIHCFRCEIRDSWIHDGAFSQPGGVAYAVSVSDGTAEALIENNIILGHNKVMVGRGAGSGNVVAYNYLDDGFIETSTAFQEIGLNGSHLEGSHHWLFEGNESFNFDSDNTHGGAIYMTVLRNHFTGVRRNTSVDWAVGTMCPAACCCPYDGGSARAVGLNYGSWWDSFVGNVLGRSGLMAGWVYEDPGTGPGNSVWTGQAAFILGWQEGQWDQQPDTKVRTTIIREGNFDYVTNTVKWDTTPTGIPTSWYVNGTNFSSATKPAFWPAACTWPWVEATGGTKLYTLPARWRFDQGTPFTTASPC